MAKISTYPIISIPTIDDLLIGTDVNDLNNTKNFTIGDIGNLIGQDYVPYVGATGNVNLGSFNITGGGFIVGGGTASQFLKADGSLDSTLYTPQTRTLTINGTTYNLSANRSWDLNTIDSLTTTGTSGAATYIGKVLNIPVYQAQGSYITQLSGEATGSGPGNATVTLDNTAVISKILTGLNVTGGTIVSTDTILQAFGKVQNQINGLTTGVTYQGVWNAATNTPFLQSSVGTQGYYYVVDVAGTTNLNGITDWQVGDWAIYNGTAWQKVDNTDAVVSVNGYVGAVVLTASDVGAVPTTRTLTINGVGYNLSADRAWTVGDVRTDQSYINPSWIASLGWSKITGTPTTLAGYGITDGALNTTTLTINGTTYDLTANRTWNVGTVTSVGTSGPLTGGTITGSGTIGITQSSSTTDGYLSSTDWNTFNSKQGAISVNAPLTFVSGVIGITQSGASTDGYLSSTDWNTFNSKVSGSGTANTLPMWGSASSLINSPLSYAADTFNFQYNSATGGTVVFTNSNGAAYAYTIQMNNFGSPRSTIHSYTDGLIIQSIGGTQVSRMFANGNLILGTGTVDNGRRLEINGTFSLTASATASVATQIPVFTSNPSGPTPRQLVTRTPAQLLSDIGAVSSVGLTMPAAFTVSNSPITSSGTIAVTAAGTAAQYIRGDGTLADFPGGGGGGGASVSYYLNGSVNQGTFGGNTYYEMSKTPIFGAGTDFNISVDGYVAQFITDAGDPDSLLIPGGNWNFETYFSASSGGGTPTFYVELYKYDGTTFTLIASNSTNPELIAFGTTVNPYFSALAVPETILLATDRLAIRIYVSTSGRTITLHTENSNLSQVITTFTTGLTALNGLTKQVQYFQTGTSGTDFNISSSVATHTFNLPTASAVNRGALSSSDWSTFNAKQNALTLTTSGSSGPATLIGATLNIPDYGSALSGYVPYTGASQAVNLGIYSLSAGSLFVNGPSPTSGSYLGFKQATSVTTGGGGYTSISTFGTSQMNFSFAQPSGFKEFKFDVSSITTGVPGGRVYTMPDADGTIALTSNIPSGIITGTGTTNYLPKFTGSTTIGNSIVQDAGIRVDIGGDIRLTPSSAVNIQAYTGSVYTNLFYNAASHNWQTSGGATKMFLNSNDNLLIGTTSDGGQRLQVTGTFALRASASGSSATQIPIFAADPSGTTRELVTRTPAQLLSDIGGQAALTNPVTGTGTTNYLPKFTGASTIGNSVAQESNGYIGIGITPSARLHVNANDGLNEGIAAAIIRQGGSSGNNGIVIDVTNTPGIYVADFRIANSSVARITNTANLLVGTTSDNGARLQVSGTATISGNGLFGGATAFAGLAGGIAVNGSTNSGINFRIADVLRGYVYVAGNLGMYVESTAGNVVLAPTGNAALTATTSGNVGIGTTSPTSLLQIDGSAPIFTMNRTSGGFINRINFSSGGTNYASIISDAGAGEQRYSIGPSAGWGGYHTFYTDTTERMRITSGGDIIGYNNFRSTVGFNLYKGSVSRGGMYDYSSISGAGTDYSTTIFSETGQGIYFAGNGSATRQMTLTSSGNLLVGTTSDNGARLQVSGSINLLNGGNRNIRIGSATNYYYDLQSTNDDFQIIEAGSTPRLTIKYPNGNVGIGTASPLTKLMVQDTANTYVAHFSGLNQANGIAIGTNSSNVAIIQGYTRTFSATNNIAMQVDGGNVGIGTTTFAYSPRLAVASVGQNSIAIQTTDTVQGSAGTILYLGTGASTGNSTFGIIRTLGNGGTAATNLVLQESGNVLIGTTTDAGYTLNVAGNAQIVRSGTSTALVAGLSGVTGSIIRFSYNGGFVGSISTDGSNTAYNTSSDYRLKQDIKDFNGLDLLSRIKPYDFEWKADKTRSYGVLAHELQEVINYAVTGSKDAEEMQGVDYSKLVPILIKAIQELNEKIK